MKRRVYNLCYSFGYCHISDSVLFDGDRSSFHTLKEVNVIGLGNISIFVQNQFKWNVLFILL